MRRHLWIALTGQACMPTATPKSDGTARFDTAIESTEDTGLEGVDAKQTMAILSTIAADFSMGAIATIDLETLEVHDALAATSGDAVVRTAEGRAIVLNRLNTDTVRLYAPDDWTAPLIEFALPDLANPQDAVICDDRLWVTQHNRAEITAHQISSGLVVGSIDLSPWAGTDGAAEAASLVAIDSTLWVAVQQFKQDDGWASEGGAIISAPCSGGDAQEVLKIGPSPGLTASPDESFFAIRTGLYGPPDGAVHLYDRTSGTLTELLTEEEVGADITSVALTQTHAVVITATQDWAYRLSCIDLESRELTQGLETSQFLSDLTINQAGQAWVASRPGWAAGTASSGEVLVFDPTTCKSLLADDSAITTALNPYNLAFL